jgi:hypothetical protein
MATGPEYQFPADRAYVVVRAPKRLLGLHKVL